MNRGRPLKVRGIKNEKGTLFATGLIWVLTILGIAVRMNTALQ
jgi:hypothetical protein